MGTTQAKENATNIVDKQDHLEFYLHADDPNLGKVKIYTSKKIPLCYILKYERIVSDSKVYNLFQKIQQHQTNSLIALYGFRIDRQTCCNKLTQEKIVSYWEYYNFYFADYLEKRSKHACMFIESQIWHIVQIVSETYSLFRKFGTYYEINPSTFLITPEGKLKALWSHLKSQNNHLKYIEYFHKNKLQTFFYSPQELQNIYEGERTTKLNFDKCNSFRLGMIILYCLCLADPIYLCYNPTMTRINFNVIKNLIITKVVPSYSSVIITLLTSLLKEDSRQRPTLMQVLQNYGKYLSSDHQLRVCGGRMPNQRRNQSQQSLNNRPSTRPPLRNQIEREKSVFSDAKTVKMAHSANKI